MLDCLIDVTFQKEDYFFQFKTILLFFLRFQYRREIVATQRPRVQVFQMVPRKRLPRPQDPQPGGYQLRRHPAGTALPRHVGKAGRGPGGVVHLSRRWRQSGINFNN